MHDTRRGAVPTSDDAAAGWNFPRQIDTIAINERAAGLLRSQNLMAL